MNSIIVHGAYGYPTENWFEWFRCKSEMCGVPCLVPSLSTPVNQSLETWLDEFYHQASDFISDETILIGHSLGAAFLLRWLERQSVTIRALILVGGFIRPVGVPMFDQINHSFISRDFDWASICSLARHREVYYGVGDQYVSRQSFDDLAERLSARKIIVANAGHFNATSGYRSFSLLWHRLMAAHGS